MTSASSVPGASTTPSSRCTPAPSAGETARVCAGCRTEARTQAEAADLEVLWLVDGLGDEPAPARYCRACQPGGPVESWDCDQCGDGPLLSGRWTRRDDLLSCGAFDEWLRLTGWDRGRGGGTGLCPECAGRAAATPAQRRHG